MHVNKVIREADILLEVLDARTVEETRNIEIERKIEKSGKKLIYVINKSDLIEKDDAEKLKKSIPNSVFVSAVERTGTKKLRDKILACSGNYAEVKVGVLGYPNTGKSSIINALKGRAAAKTSSVSGYTRGVQKVRISRRIMLLDTPGVFPYKERDEGKHAMTAARSTHDIKDVELAAMDLIEALKGRIEKYYDAEKGADAEETLENIAVAMKKLKRKGEPDTKLAAKTIIHDWQIGKIV